MTYDDRFPCTRPRVTTTTCPTRLFSRPSRAWNPRYPALPFSILQSRNRVPRPIDFVVLLLLLPVVRVQVL